jgi:hypothetical protein
MLAGTVARAVALEVKLIVTSCVDAALAVIVPTTVPTPSVVPAGRLTVSAAVSLSCTFTAPVAEL